MRVMHHTKLLILLFALCILCAQSARHDAAACKATGQLCAIAADCCQVPRPADCISVGTVQTVCVARGFLGDPCGVPSHTDLCAVGVCVNNVCVAAGGPSPSAAPTDAVNATQSNATALTQGQIAGIVIGSVAGASLLLGAVVATVVWVVYAV